MISLAITIIVTLLVVGLLLWAVDHMPWISPDVKRMISIVVIVMAGLWVIAMLFPGHMPVAIKG